MDILRIYIFFGCLLLSSFSSIGQNGTPSTDGSVLREGTWFKIGVTTKGIYKIDRAFLQNAGVNTNSLDPRKLALYGNGGGGMLPQPNAIQRPYDLRENAIVVSGEDDGSFDAADYILFFGNTPDEYSYQENCDCYHYQKNLYSDTTFYFLRIDAPGGKRIENRVTLQGSAEVITAYDDLYAYEKDDVKLWESGRHWLGDRFDAAEPSRVYTLGSGSYVPDSEVNLVSSVAAQSNGATSFDLSANGAHLATQHLAALSPGQYDPKGTLATDTITFSSAAFGPDENPELQLNFNRAAVTLSVGYLDFLFVQGKKKLQYSQNELYFRNTASRQLPLATYRIGNAGSIYQLWDISDPVVPVRQEFTLADSDAQFTMVPDGLHEFVAFDESSFKTPVSIKGVGNQNLKDGRVPELVVITHKRFLQEANRLAAFRRSNDGLDVKVVLIDQVYNEFSSGMQDISAIRDYMRYLYKSSPGQLKYLLLFGDCSYDYKARTADQNLVPVYQSRESLDQITSFSSDDYFGFLDDDEGEWVEEASGDHLLDIGIGRLPVITMRQATNIVNKIVSYTTGQDGLGAWRTDIYFLADDGDANIHLRDANRLASYVDTAYAQFNVNKIYLDAFPQVLQGNVQRSPAMYESVKNAFHNGAFIVNYSGHGNATVLTDERVVTMDSITKWTNGNRLPLFLTATCDFGRYDNPAQESGAENLIRNPNGGAIALLTTTRAVYSYTNFILNQAFYYEIFKKIDGEYPRLGDVVRKTKNNSLQGVLNRNFALLGDPSMRLNYPTYNLKVTHLNDTPVDGVPDTVSAMNKVKVDGIVADGAGNPVPAFEGQLTVTMYDKPASFSTLGDESQRTTYESWSNVLYRGKVSIKEGAFSYEFVVPKNTSYQQARGKITMYARPENGIADANGATIDFFLGGSKPPAYADNKPPVVEAFINDDSFRPGQTVNATPLLLLRLADESGINISGKGIGQNITFQLDDEEQVVVNNYYVADLDDFTSGVVLYPLNTLKPGKHILTVKAWDTFSNSTTSTIDFVVSNDTKVKISSVVSYPNPATESVIFRLEHDRGDHLLSIRMQLIDQGGAVIDEMEWQTNNTGGLVESPAWNRQYNGRRIENGIYIYRLFVTDEQDGNQNFAFGKLILTN